MSDPKPARIPAWAILVLLTILVFDVWLRCHTIGPTIRDRLGVDLWPVTGAEAEPLDCDEAVYAYTGRKIVHGSVMYRDLTEPKPPGGYWLYALAVAFGGANELTVRVTPIPIVLATIVLVWWIALRLGGPFAACLAALIYSVASTDPFLFGNGANLEHPINLFSTASLALMIAGWDGTKRGRILAAGACLGIACLFKQVAFTHGLVYAAALCLRRRPLEVKLRDLVALALGFALVWGIAFLVLFLQGAGAAAFEDIVRYSSAMAADTPAEANAPSRWVRWFTGNADPQGELPWPFGKTNYLVWWGTGTWPLWLAAIPATAALGLPRTSTPGRRLVAAWTLSAWIQVALPGLFWQHYYLLPLPGIAIASATYLADLAGSIRTKPSRRLVLIPWASAFILALGATAFLQVRDYLMVPPEALTVRYKGGGQWVALRALGRDLGRRAKGWESTHIYVWGWQSPLYVYSGLDGVSRHFFSDPLLKAYAMTGHPLTTPRVARIMADLKEHPPELIFCGDPPFPALKQFLLERYFPSRVVPTTPDGRGLWVEKDHYGPFETSRQPLR